MHELAVYQHAQSTMQNGRAVEGCSLPHLCIACKSKIIAMSVITCQPACWCVQEGRHEVEAQMEKSDEGGDSVEAALHQTALFCSQLGGYNRGGDEL